MIKHNECIIIMSKTLLVFIAFAEYVLPACAKTYLIAHYFQEFEDIARVSLKLSVMQRQVIISIHLQTYLQCAILSSQLIVLPVECDLYTKWNSIYFIITAEKRAWLYRLFWLLGSNARQIFELLVNCLRCVGAVVQYSLILALAFTPFMPALDRILEALEVSHYFFIEKSIISLYFCIPLFLQHIFFLFRTFLTFLFSLRRFSEVLMLLMLLVDSLRLPYDFVCCLDMPSRLRNSLKRLRCSEEFIFYYNHQQNQMLQQQHEKDVIIQVMTKQLFLYLIERHQIQI